MGNFFLAPSWVLTMLVCGLLMQPVNANAAPGEDVRLNVNTQVVGKGDVDGGGRYSRTDTNVTAGYKWFTFSYHRSDYDWSDTGRMAFSKRSGKPWDALQRLAFDAKADGQLSDSMGWFVGGTVVSAFEDEMKDSFSFLGRGGLSIVLTSEWSMKLGAIGLLSPVHPMLIPMLQLDWRDARDWGFSGTIGMPASTLRYRFNDVVGTRLTGYWSRDLYRLADDSTVERKGYVEESGITVGAYLDVTPLSGLTLTAGAEVQADRELRIYDRDGDKLSKNGVDSSLGGVLRLNYAF